MAVQVGRTVISFTIKYMQSEKEKLKSDITKVLDSKNKKVATKAIAALPFAENDADPQGTNYPNINVPMNEENDEADQMNDNWARLWLSVKVQIKMYNFLSNWTKNKKTTNIKFILLLPFIILIDQLTKI